MIYYGWVWLEPNPSSKANWRHGQGKPKQQTQSRWRIVRRSFNNPTNAFQSVELICVSIWLKHELGPQKISYQTKINLDGDVNISTTCMGYWRDALMLESHCVDSVSVICLISPSWDMICTYLHNMATYWRVKSRTCVYVFPSGSVHLNIKDNYCLSVSLSLSYTPTHTKPKPGPFSNLKPKVVWFTLWGLTLCPIREVDAHNVTM